MNKAELAALVARLPEDAVEITCKDRRGTSLFYTGKEVPGARPSVKPRHYGGEGGRWELK